MFLLVLWATETFRLQTGNAAELTFQISTIPTQHHPTGYIVSNADDLLQIFDADAGLLVIGDGCKLLGQSEQGQAMLAIAEYFRILKFE